jgi:hypothetical protein
LLPVTSRCTTSLLATHTKSRPEVAEEMRSQPRVFPKDPCGSELPKSSALAGVLMRLGCELNSEIGRDFLRVIFRDWKESLEHDVVATLRCRDDFSGQGGGNRNQEPSTGVATLGDQALEMASEPDPVVGGLRGGRMLLRHMDLLVFGGMGV